MREADNSSIELSELDGVHEFNRRLADINDTGATGLDVNALNVDGRVSLLGISLGLIVGANTSPEGFTASGEAAMLDTDVEALRDDASANALVADDTDGVLGYVEHLASFAVVELVGHTSLDGTVSNDVNEVTLLVGDEVLAQGSNTVFPESLTEEISRASS